MPSMRFTSDALVSTTMMPSGSIVVYWTFPAGCCCGAPVEPGGGAGVRVFNDLSPGSVQTTGLVMPVSPSY